MQQGETIECIGQSREAQVVAANLHARRIPAAAPIEASDFEGGADKGRRRVPVLRVKEIQPLPEYLRLVINFDSQALARIDGSQPLLQPAAIRVVHGVSPGG